VGVGIYLGASGLAGSHGGYRRVLRATPRQWRDRPGQGLRQSSLHLHVLRRHSEPVTTMVQHRAMWHSRPGTPPSRPHRWSNSGGSEASECTDRRASPAWRYPHRPESIRFQGRAPPGDHLNARHNRGAAPSVRVSHMDPGDRDHQRGYSRCARHPRVHEQRTRTCYHSGTRRTTGRVTAPPGVVTPALWRGTPWCARGPG
jgi:hypothetical protein